MFVVWLLASLNIFFMKNLLWNGRLEIKIELNKACVNGGLVLLDFNLHHISRLDKSSKINLIIRLDLCLLSLWTLFSFKGATRYVSFYKSQIMKESSKSLAKFCPHFSNGCFAKKEVEILGHYCFISNYEKQKVIK